MWKQWINAILGVAVIVFALIGGDHTIRYAVVGAIVVVLAVWSALEKRTPTV